MAGKQRNALPIGDDLHNYRIVDVLGSGGFGITYMATEAVTERRVAIKEFLPANIAVRDHDSRSVHPISESDRDDFAWGLDRFRQEAKVLITLEHRNIVPVLNYFEANGTGYLVMAYQDGKSLGALLKRDMKLSQTEIDDILLPIADGVGTIHAAGFLHRDIKPDNIFVRADGVPVIIDFGSARLALGEHTKSLTAIVSEGYAPFEQYQSDGNQGPWTDIYALGATLYRCVTGRRPVEAPARVAAIVKGKPDPIEPAAVAAAEGGYRPALLAAIDRAMAVDESARPQTIEALKTILEDAAAAGQRIASESGATTMLVGGAPNETRPHAAADRSDRAAEGAAGGPMGPDAQRTGTTAAASRPGRRPRWALAAAAFAVLLAGGASAYVAVERPWETGVDQQALLQQQEDERRAEAEAKRKAEEQARKQADTERKAEEEARRKAEEEARQRAEAERDAQEDEAQRKAEAEARKQAEEEARKQTEAEARRKAEEEARQRAEAERRAQEEARRQAHLEAQRKAQEEARRQAEAEARRKAEEEARRKAEQEARQRAEAERRAQEEARRQAQLEAQRKAQEEARKQAEAEAQRKAAEAARQRAAQKERQKALAERREERAEARRKALEERRKQIAEQRRRQQAARTPSAADYVAGKKLFFKVETGRGLEFYEIAVFFSANGALSMRCGFTNFRGIPGTCREYTGGPGRWSLSGNTLCLQFRHGRNCFTMVKRGNGYALAARNRDVQVRYFK